MPSYVIVGASRGLGYEWLRQLSKDAGNTVIGLARTPGPVEDKLRADNITNVKVFQADMADHRTLNAAAARVSALTNGALDYLVINGVFSDPQTMSVTPRGFIGKEDVLRKDMISGLDVNVLGAAYSINAFLPLIEKGTVKKIVAISTGMADPEALLDWGFSQFVTYSTIKAALNMIVVKYAIELKKDGITVLAVSPGLVNTRETPPTPQEVQEFTALVKTMQTTYPNFQGPISPEESVTAVRKVIDSVGIEQTGQFVSHWGNKKWL
ncbi:NAD(P)-binding domain protein [Niveomyces insectorum RCEF 264]|uniref:NAD(P)-binding domain protein n=1 Tax=Niveomyces insectorum RCEF 264 TaxID=1081102 RepID=A0A167QZB4_9HYPO|nr:NAD(P)-binding domain protein [Niveomyces insectorum RCEF 264]